MSTSSTSEIHPKPCPRCKEAMLMYLRSMRKYGARDWFKCDACHHIFTVPHDLERAIEFDNVNHAAQ